MRIIFELVNDVSGVKDSDIIEWLKFKLGQVGQMKTANPLCDEDIEAKYVEIFRGISC